MPVALVEGDYAVEEYGPMVRSWNQGFMLRVDNFTSTYVLVSSAGTVPVYRMAGQSRLFVQRIDRDSGRTVVLLKPGASAQFVVDENMCPPNGARCEVRVEAASYNTRVPRVKRLGRTRNRSFNFTGSEPVGLYWTLN
jgi:hypothetical protein